MRIAALTLVFAVVVSSDALAQGGASTSWERSYENRQELLYQLNYLDATIRYDRELLFDAEQSMVAARKRYDTALTAANETADREAMVSDRLDEARTQERAVVSGLRNRIAREPWVEEAKNELRTANAAFAAERKRAIEPLYSSPEYVELQSQLVSARARLVEIDPADDSKRDQRDEFARQVQELKNRIAAVEKEALRADTGYLAAEAAVKVARIKVAKTRKAIDERYRTSEERQAAIAEHKTARQESKEIEGAAADAWYEVDAAQIDYDRASEEHARILERIEYSEFLYEITQNRLAGMIRPTRIRPGGGAGTRSELIIR